MREKSKEGEFRKRGREIDRGRKWAKDSVKGRERKGERSRGRKREGKMRLKIEI